VYQIQLSKKALKSLETFPSDYQIQIKKGVKRLEQDPFSLDIKKMQQSTATHRLRLGPYRIFLKINTTLKTIIVAKIDRRTTQTYH
jgi:mRNA-degrading endonuclease RelE of RelBE toxin-antitoxin system